MIVLSNSEKMRAADTIAMEQCGIPSTSLMNAAAWNLSSEALSFLHKDRKALIFCGCGNNGGDGIGAAVNLEKCGVETRILLVGQREKLSKDAAAMLRIYEGFEKSVEIFSPETRYDFSEFGVIIDALFGIGLNKPLQGDALAAVRLINALPLPVIAADIASGVEADTGRILGDAVRADMTVTFSLAKPGHFLEPGCSCCGQLRITDIGIPNEVLAPAALDIYAVTEEDTALPRRERSSHKGDYGRLLIVGGSIGYTGAPNFASRAAVRAGAGLVYLGVPQPIYEICAVKNEEAMPFPLPADAEGRLSARARDKIFEKLSRCDAAVIGPGLGRSEELTALVQELVKTSEIPLILDADALFALSQDMTVLQQAHCPLVLTPHEGEFLRMGGEKTGDRFADARSFARQHGVALVYKGHRSITAFPDGEVYVNTTGNPGMAKGGSGDVLSGILGALAVQFPLKQAVVTGVYLHGAAGDACAKRNGEYAMTPTDVTETLPEVMKALEE